MRSKADITILRVTRTQVAYTDTVAEVATVPVTPACRRKFRLMGEDSITLSFSAAVAFPILPGDFIEDELFGTFYAKEQQMPTYNTRTGGYDYTLTFVARCWLWDSHLLMFCSKGFEEVLAWGDRKEAQWVLTATLEEHVKAALANVKALGLTKSHAIVNGTWTPTTKTLNYVIEESAERAQEVRFLAYDKVGICQGLTMMAEEYGCEWWVTEDATEVTVHFGKCETGEAVDFALGDNMESVTAQRNQNSYANRVYALGSTQNLPASYRKAITFTIQGGEQKTVGTDEGIDEGAEIHVDNDEEGNIVNPKKMVTGTTYWRFRTDKDITKEMFKEYTAFAKIGMPPVVGDPVTTGYFIGIDDDNCIFVYKGNVYPGAVLGITANDVFQQSDIPAFFGDGKTLDIVFHNPYSTAAYCIYNPTTDVSANVAKCGLIPTRVPDAWWLDEYDDPSSLVAMGERRLRLPKAATGLPEGITLRGGCLERGTMPEEARVEELVVFEGVCPKCYLRVTSVKAEAMKKDGEKLPDGSTNSWKWTKYTLQVENYLDGSEFPFTASFVKDKLEAVFLSKTDEENAYGMGWQPHDGYLLAGMTFGVEFHERDDVVDNVTTHVREYVLVRNDDYGAMLPNETLRPMVGDVFVLTGWDPKAMENLGMVATAERDLLAYTTEYLEAIEEGNFLFQCRMMSDRMALLPSPYPAGQRVRIHHPALKGGSKVSRVIGYELKLDIPYDTPVYEVGETDAYSRLKRIEKAMAGDAKDVHIRVRKDDKANEPIRFADAEVKRICVENWGGGAVTGEITRGEAAAVTSLAGAFRGNAQITSFDELKYFTGLEKLNIAGTDNGEFYGCSSLESITLPSLNLEEGVYLRGLFNGCTSLREVDLSPVKGKDIWLNYTFYACSALVEVTIPGGEYRAAYCGGTFRACKSLTTIHIDGEADWSGITSFGDGNYRSFYNCTALANITGTIAGPTDEYPDRGIKVDLDMQSCPLTRDSALVIINGLADLTGKASKTLTLSAATKALLTTADTDIITAKNWTLA